MSGICDKCMRKPCSGKGEGLIFCDFYIRAERNYDKLFGTPERAARTLYYDKEPICSGCALLDVCTNTPEEELDTCLIIDHNALLEWLESEARDD